MFHPHHARLCDYDRYADLRKIVREVVGLRPLHQADSFYKALELPRQFATVIVNGVTIAPVERTTHWPSRNKFIEGHDI